MAELDPVVDESKSSDFDPIPPEQQPPDYIEIGLLICMVVVGGPLNLISLFRSSRTNFRLLFRACLNCICRMSNSDGGRSARTATFGQRRLTLRFHLTVANLLVLWVYGISEICWLFTYSWLGGDLLCRTIRFVHAVCFYATSNLVAAIALDRLYVTVYIDRPKSRSLVSRRVKKRGRWFSYVAWALAVLFSTPQLYIWRTFEPIDGWKQCVTIWTIQKFNFLLITNDTINGQIKLHNEEKLYDALHLAFVFWIPAIFIIASHAAIVKTLNWNIRKRSGREARKTWNLPLLSNFRGKSSTTLGERSCLSQDWNDCKRNGKSSTSLLENVRFSALNDYTCNTLYQAQNTSTDESASGTAITLPTIITSGITKMSNGQSNEMLECSETKPVLVNGSNTSFAVITLTRAKRRTVKKTVWILLAYFVFWSPYNVLALWRFFYPTFENSYLEIMYNLIVLNAVVNPLIYGI